MLVNGMRGSAGILKLPQCGPIAEPHTRPNDIATKNTIKVEYKVDHYARYAGHRRTSRLRR